MAGFNSKNLISAQGSYAISSSIASPLFKVHEADVNGLVVQITAPSDPGLLTVESSLDGGLTWYTIPSAAIAAYGNGARRYRITPGDMADAGPLMRILTANAVTATAIWVTVRS